MLLEAVDRPIRYTWPKGELRFEPGKPIKVPDTRGQKVLAKCGNKVRKFSPDWLMAWTELARITNGITKDGSRFNPIMAGLARCDLAFEQDDWVAFVAEANQVKALINGNEREKT
ncbi:MAG: hypothetical protein IH977_15295 [Nitrospinae bacterium]|nr:hypothetical protein [Nitrospinota bacterium]